MVRIISYSLKCNQPARVCRVDSIPAFHYTVMLNYLVLTTSRLLYALSLIDGLVFNGTPTKVGQFMPTAEEVNWLSRLGMANEIQCILPYVTQKTLKYSSQYNTSVTQTQQPVIQSNNVLAFHYVSGFANTKCSCLFF